MRVMWKRRWWYTEQDGKVHSTEILYLAMLIERPTKDYVNTGGPWSSTRKLANTTTRQSFQPNRTTASKDAERKWEETLCPFALCFVYSNNREQDILCWFINRQRTHLPFPTRLFDVPFQYCLATTRYVTKHHRFYRSIHRHCHTSPVSPAHGNRKFLYYCIRQSRCHVTNVKISSHPEFAAYGCVHLVKVVFVTVLRVFVCFAWAYFVVPKRIFSQEKIPICYPS